MKRKLRIAAALLVIPALLVLAGCDAGAPVSSSGVNRAEPPKVQTDGKGNTIEQNAAVKRILRDNTPGSLKHAYIISAYTGQIIAYSTVQGKVTSSGKRVTLKTIPESVFSGDNKRHQGFNFVVGDEIKSTSEVLGDDGTYGDSVWYLYWFDEKDNYHQHFPTDDQIILVKETPIAVPFIRGSINLDGPKK